MEKPDWGVGLPRPEIDPSCIQRAIETLIEAWTQELVSGGQIDRGETPGRLRCGRAPRIIRRVRRKLNTKGS